MGKIDMKVNGHDGQAEEMGVLLCQSRNLPFLFSKIRHVDTESKDFAFYAMRLMKLIAEDALALLATTGMCFVKALSVRS